MVKNKRKWAETVPKLQDNIFLDYHEADSTDSGSGSRISGIFVRKGRSVLAALQKEQ